MVAYDHKMNKRFATIGTFGALVCSVADYLLEYLGRESETLGSIGQIETAWLTMGTWRFTASLIIAAVVIPLYGLGLFAVYRQMNSTHPTVAKAYGICTAIGMLGSFFIHGILCLLPIAFKTAYVSGDLNCAVAVVDAMTSSMMIPFFTYYTLLVPIPAAIWAVYCLKKGSLYSPKYAVIVLGITLLCIVLEKIIPSLSFLSVGSISRMLAMISAAAWYTEEQRKLS